MTSKFTSRFRRSADEGSAKTGEAVESAQPTPAEPVTEAIASPADVSEKDASADVVARTNPAEATDTVTEPVVTPARLVEIERPKAEPPKMETPKLASVESWLSNAHAYRAPAAAAAALVVALLTGYGLGASGQFRASANSSALLAQTTQDLRATNGQLGQFAAELKSIKGVVEGMKGDREKSRGDIVSKQSQISERLERTGQENATRIGRLAEQLDRIEKAQRDATRQASADKAAEKADKPEKTAAAPLPPAKPNREVAHTGSLGDQKNEPPKADPRKTPLDGYVVRDYDDGYALIETRSGRYIDVSVGYTLPGVGKVEAIERRGRQWVVVTPKGYIGER